ncbi:MAG: hypothetical protein JKX75_06295 [Gammaproteobacteria bacterium]|nr:hypothetical protein [Gammaproteobacteria bacterium]
MNKTFNILWLQPGGCGGFNMSVRNTELPDVYTVLDALCVDASSIRFFDPCMICTVHIR